MGFKVIETEEEFEAALAAGLLWINSSTQWPRPQEGWETCGWYEPQRACEKWRQAKENGRKASYLPEDFAVLVEEEDDSL
jgi:hypothetical protein